MDIERIIKIGQLSLVVLIACGAIDNYIYFHTFHLNIFVYLSFGEILTSFVNLLVPILLFVALLAIRGLGFFDNKKNKPEKLIFIERYYLAYSPLYISIISLTILLLLGAIIQTESDGNPDNWYIKNWGNLVLYGFGSFIAFFLVFPIQVEINELKKIDSKTNQLMYFKSVRQLVSLGILLMVFMTIFGSLGKVKNVILNKKGVTTLIVTSDNDTIRTNSRQYYIGRTNDYVFLFDSSENRTDIFPKASVKKISFTYKNK